MDGKGLASQVAPPFAGSARVNGDKDILLNTVLHGLKGPIDNKNYPDAMVAQKEHNDQYIASVLSYIRNSFGNKQPVVKPKDVRNLRDSTVARQTAWTLDELNILYKNQNKNQTK